MPVDKEYISKLKNLEAAVRAHRLAYTQHNIHSPLWDEQCDKTFNGIKDALRALNTKEER